MTTTIDTNQWCSRFVKCKGCKLDAECMVKPEEMALVREDGKIVDKWAIRTTEMIARGAGKTKGYIVCLLLAASHRGEYERHTALGC